MHPIVHFDLETGGLALEHPIIQIAAVAAMPNGQIVREFQRKIDFDRHEADPEALKINHFDEAVWQKEQKPLVQVLAEFAGFLKPYCFTEMISKRTGKGYMVARLAGYNCATFDMPRLSRAYKEFMIFLPAHPAPYDVMQLAMWHFLGYARKPASFKLADVCAYCGIPIDGAHDALVDVKACAALAASLMGMDQQKGDEE